MHFFRNRTLTTTRASRLGAALLTITLFAGCSPAIAPFSLHAYEQAVDLKVDALHVMKLAELPYEENSKTVSALLIRLEKAHEFAKGRPQNEHSTRQWELMIDPKAHLLGGFIVRWQSEITLTSTFITEAGHIIEDGFDTIIRLESGKIGNNQN